MPEFIHRHEWAEGSRTRVLVEAAEWRAREQLTTVLREPGYDTLSCPGPEGAGQRCPLAAGDGCRAAEEVDVVVHALHPSDLRNVEALRALRHRLPEVPVVVEASAPDAERRSVELEGCVVVEAPASPAALLEAVSRALGDKRADG